MQLDLQIKDKTKKIELLEKNGNFHKVKVDDKIYEIDAIKTSSNVFSIVYNNTSYDLEFAKPNPQSKKYSIHNRNRYFDFKVIDAQTKYQINRKGGAAGGDDSNVISTPMPGAIVKIPVKVGDKVKEGDVVIVVEAMKMQSEYKAGGDRTVKQILVKEGDSITGDQPLVILE